MRNTLFRPQAIEHQRQRLTGSVLITPSLPAQVITLLLLIWLAVVVMFLATQQFSRKETVNGWLEPAGGALRVHAAGNGGQISEILVREGQQVSAGTPLVKLNTATSSTHAKSMEHTLLEEYQAQLNRVEARLQRSEQRHTEQQESLRQTINSYQSDLAQLTRLLELANERLALAQAQHRQLAPLVAEGLAPQQDLQTLTASQLQIQQELHQLQRDVRRSQQALHDNQAQLRQLPRQHLDATASLLDDQSTLRQHIARLEAAAEGLIRAPIDGVISSLTAHVGQFTQAGVPLMTLLPQGTDLEARLLVPVRAAGFVNEGQALTIRYDAFPYQKFGMQAGAIRTFSAAVVLPGDLRDAPVTVNEPAYLARAVLASKHLAAYGKPVALRPGMTFTADVQLSERTLAEWLFEPLYSLAGRL
ncbi:HlyD family efflux transporter periplasmic adaptor subunit [Alteromonas sp. ASW11-19]|uniref:HlyD family efflux transporter periplasmic adaptor subunit n=1 Tax=Alteromonas salexigens TaxID=2982530 RepID=A0ABT2VNP1_9ALTE|nr:HlyD family efflux transporter periplasmic adaptor subunit [Alteromonas salexigens]MCU7554513.1 HlyD family efflux transporter periplasmic adaptor subunit [Alteromonas salexigens]